MGLDALGRFALTPLDIQRCEARTSTLELMGLAAGYYMHVV